MVPVGHHVMAFIPYSLPEQSIEEQKSKLCMCVHCVFAFTKAVHKSMSILVG